jgi:hypothetical protein
MDVKSRSVTVREEHKLRNFLDDGAEENIQTYERDREKIMRCKKKS